MSKNLFVLLALLAASAIAIGFWYFRSRPVSVPLEVYTTPMSQPQASNEPASSASVSKATLKTARGEIVIELYPERAPKTVENFAKLSREGFYAGTKFHRVIPGFVVQGGDPLSRTDDPRVGTGGPGYVFGDEINPKALGLSDIEIGELQAMGYQYDFSLQSLPVDVGVIAMANSGPNTNGSQFFIVTDSAQPHLNGKHTVFGRVVSGMDTVRAVRQGDVIESITIQ